MVVHEYIGPAVPRAEMRQAYEKGLPEQKDDPRLFQSRLFQFTYDDSARMPKLGLKRFAVSHTSPTCGKIIGAWDDPRYGLMIHWALDLDDNAHQFAHRLIQLGGQALSLKTCWQEGVQYPLEVSLVPRGQRPGTFIQEINPGSIHEYVKPDVYIPTPKMENQQQPPPQAEESTKLPSLQDVLKSGDMELIKKKLVSLATTNVHDKADNNDMVDEIMVSLDRQKQIEELKKQLVELAAQKDKALATTKKATDLNVELYIKQLRAAWDVDDTILPDATTLTEEDQQQLSQFTKNPYSQKIVAAGMFKRQTKTSETDDRIKQINDRLNNLGSRPTYVQTQQPPKTLVAPAGYNPNVQQQQSLMLPPGYQPKSAVLRDPAFQQQLRYMVATNDIGGSFGDKTLNLEGGEYQVTVGSKRQRQ